VTASATSARRHQLAGLVAVVEPERHADEVGVQRVAQVELDAEGLPARDEAAAHHQQRLRHTECDGDPNQRPELVTTLGDDRPVDHAARHEHEPDRRGL
jgi:hypothetical protein